MKTAIITGITGQDGAYLSKLLLEKGYKVVGTTRTYNYANLKKLSHLAPTIITLHDMRLLTSHCARSFDCKNGKLLSSKRCFGSSEFGG